MVDRKTATSHTHTDKLSCLVLLSFLVFSPLSLTHKHSASFLVDLFLLSLPQSCALAFFRLSSFLSPRLASLYTGRHSAFATLSFFLPLLFSLLSQQFFRCFALLFTKISLKKTPSPPKKKPSISLTKMAPKAKTTGIYLPSFLSLFLSRSLIARNLSPHPHYPHSHPLSKRSSAKMTPQKQSTTDSMVSTFLPLSPSLSLSRSLATSLPHPHYTHSHPLSKRSLFYFPSQFLRPKTKIP